VLSPH